MAIISKPNSTANGTTADGAAASANWDVIYAEFNGNIDNNNVKSNAGIVDTKLAQITTASKVSTSALTGTLTNAVSTTNISADTLTGTTLSCATITATTLNATTIETVAWADYGATSTIIGWSGTTAPNIYTKKIGKTVFIGFSITGVSNSTSTNFTVPYISNSGVNQTSLGRGQNTGGNFDFCIISQSGGSTLTNLYYGVLAGTWSNNGTKTVQGQFFYEST